MSYIGKVDIDNTGGVPVASTLYGECTVEANNATKSVTLSNFDYILDNVKVKVKFTNTNTASNPTLKVGSTNALAIRTRDGQAPGTTPGKSWHAGEVVSFTYVINSGAGYWYMSDAREFVSDAEVVTDVTVTPGSATTFTLNNTTLEITTGTAPTVTPSKERLDSLVE